MGLSCFSEIGMITFRHSYQPVLEGGGVGGCLKVAEASDLSPHQMSCFWGGGGWWEISIWGIGNWWCAKYLYIIFYSECECWLAKVELRWTSLFISMWKSLLMSIAKLMCSLKLDCQFLAWLLVSSLCLTGSFFYIFLFCFILAYASL